MCEDLMVRRLGLAMEMVKLAECAMRNWALALSQSTRNDTAQFKRCSAIMQRYKASPGVNMVSMKYWEDEFDYILTAYEEQ